MYSQPTRTDLNQSTRLANLQAERTSTNEEARSLPWFCGRRPVPMTWLCNPLNVTTVDIEQKVGKDKQTTGQNYYIDIAGGLCVGPVYGVRRITKQGEVIWEGERLATGSSYVDIDVPGHGLFRLHWGSEELIGEGKQWLVLNKEPDGDEAVPMQVHPDYVGQCVLEISQLFCGNSSVGSAPPVPDIEVELLRKPQSPSLPDGLHMLAGANPVAALWELGTNERVGGGWPDSLDAASWVAVASALANNQTSYYIAPLLTTDEKLRTVTGEVLSYFDGFIYTHQGKLALGYYPHDGVVPNVVELTHDHIVEKNHIRPGSLEDTINQVNARFDNVERGFKEDGVTAVSAYNRALVGEVRIEKYDPRFSIYASQVSRLIQEKLHTQSFPIASGTTVVPIADAVDKAGQKIRPGKSRFKLDDSDYALDLIVRCTARRDDLESGTTTLDWEQERGLFPLDYVSSQITIAPTVEIIAPVEYAQVVELPRELTGSVRTTIAILAAQPAGNAQGLRVHYGLTGTSYDLLSVQSSWALRASLQADFTQAVEWDPSKGQTRPTKVHASFPILVDGVNAALLQSQSQQAWLDNTLLAWIGGELHSIGTVVAQGDGRYILNTMRGRYRTPFIQAQRNDPVWIIRRVDLQLMALQHEGFAQLATRWFKLQVIVPGRLEPIEDSTVISYRFAQREARAPVIQIKEFPTAPETGKIYTVEGTIEDQNEDLANWSMVVNGVGGSRIVGGSPVSKRGYLAFSVPVSWEKPGAYTITVTASDLTEGDILTSSASVSVTVTGPEVTPDEQKKRIDDIDGAMDESRRAFEDLKNDVDAWRTSFGEEMRGLIKSIIDGMDEFDAKLGAESAARKLADGGMTTKVDWAVSRAKDNSSAIVKTEETLATLQKSMSSIEEGLLSKIDLLSGLQKGTSEALNLLRTNVQRDVANIRSEVDEFEVRSAGIEGKLYDFQLEANRTYASQQAVGYLNGQIVATNKELNELNVRHNETKASVTVMAEAFIGPDGRVRSLYAIEVDANGKFARLTTIAQNDGRQSYSAIRVEADAFEVRLKDGEWYSLVTEHAVCQIVAARSYEGKPSWQIRNIFGGIFRRVSGNDVGGSAEVLVHTSDGV